MSISQTGRGKRKQMGFTAVELIVVLIVALGILALSAGKIEMLFGGSAIAEETGNVSVLNTNLRSLKTTSGYGTANTNLTASMIAINGIPKNMSVISSVIYNTWGGAVVPKSTGPGYTISYATVPQDACIKLSTKISSGGTFSEIKINANAPVTGEVTTAVATTQCNSPTANTLLFTSN